MHFAVLELNGNNESRMCVGGGHPPMMELDGAPGNGEAKSDTTGVPGAVLLGPDEGMEDALEKVRRHARPKVADFNEGVSIAGVETDFDGGSRW